MSLLFFVMVVSSITWLTFTDPSTIMSTALAAANSGITLSLTLAGIYIFWMGVIQVATDAGLIAKLSRALRPIIRWLFGKQDAAVNDLIATNISANMIGAGNAATPAAIDAIEKMAKPDQKRASTAMIMLFVISATSMQILPTTVLGILETHGAQNAASIIFPTLLVSTATTLLGIFLVKWLSRKENKPPNDVANELEIPKCKGVNDAME